MDRQIEFFEAQGLIRIVLEKLYPSTIADGCDFGTSSCEMIAYALLQKLAKDGAMWVSVFEDDENGSKVEIQ